MRPVASFGPKTGSLTASRAPEPRFSRLLPKCRSRDGDLLANAPEFPVEVASTGKRGCYEGLILLSLSPLALAQVRLYDLAGCYGDYVELGHTQYADLSSLTWPGGGSVNQDVSAVYIPPWDADWEVYACDFTNFNGGCSKQFDLDDEIGWGCINMSGTGWDTDELPPDQDISSIIIQPSIRDTEVCTRVLVSSSAPLSSTIC